jgi:hypothetical protein
MFGDRKFRTLLDSVDNTRHKDEELIMRPRDLN